MIPLRWRRLWLGLGRAYIILIVVLSLWPAEDLPQLAFEASDKVLHFLAYAFMMLWFAQLVPASRYCHCAIAFFVLGVMLELLQSWTGVRHRDYWDMAVNGMGIGAAWALARAGANAWLARLEQYWL